MIDRFIDRYQNRCEDRLRSGGQLGLVDEGIKTGWSFDLKPCAVMDQVCWCSGVV